MPHGNPNYNHESSIETICEWYYDGRIKDPKNALEVLNALDLNRLPEDKQSAQYKSLWQGICVARKSGIEDVSELAGYILRMIEQPTYNMKEIMAMNRLGI